MTSLPLLLVRLSALFVHNINLSLLGFLGGFPAKYKKKYMIQRFKFSKKIFSSTKKKTLIKKNDILYRNCNSHRPWVKGWFKQ